MKRIVAVIALACAAILPAACGPQGESAAEGSSPATAAAASDAASVEVAETTSSAPAAATAAGGTAAPAAPDAPAFAVLYPAATLDAPAVISDGPSGPGGFATYATQAAPDAVIAFHRERAEAAGLTSTMEMNQGEARAYGATSRDGGKTLSVVASAIEDGPTSVQLTWSAGR